jgi:hypothetical protein
VKVLILAMLLALVPSLVLAQDGQDHNSCNAADDTPQADVISDCKQLLESGKPDRDERATLYYNRGAAHWQS